MPALSLLSDLSDQTRRELEAAYRQTTYRVEDGAAQCALRIGATHPALEDLLTRLDVTTWAFLTAVNPGSAPLPPEENAQRQTALTEVVQARGWTHFVGRSVGDAGDWEEPGLLVAGIPRAEAIVLGRKFGQNAIVVGERARAAELLWLR